jgi:hypothetical protein
MQLLLTSISAKENPQQQCEKPDEAAASRNAFLARCADEGWAIAPTHFLVPRVTKVRRVEHGFDLMQ